jgi:hypothetical protein
MTNTLTLDVIRTTLVKRAAAFGPAPRFKTAGGLGEQ